MMLNLLIDYLIFINTLLFTNLVTIKYEIVYQFEWLLG